MDASVTGMLGAVQLPDTVQIIDYEKLYRSVYNASEGLRADLETDWKGSRTRKVELGLTLLHEAVTDMAPNHAENYPAFERLVYFNGGAEFAKIGILHAPLIQFIESEIFAHSVSARDPRKHGNEPGWHHLLDTRERFLRCSEDILGPRNLLTNDLRIRGAIVLPGHDCYEDFDVTTQELNNVFRSSIDAFCSYIPHSIWLMSTPKPEELIFQLPHITKKHTPHIASELANLKIGSKEAKEMMETFKMLDPLAYAMLKFELKTTFKPRRMLLTLGAVEAGGKMADGGSILDEWLRNIENGDIRLDPTMPFGTKNKKIPGQPTAVPWDLIMVNIDSRIDYHNTGLRRLTAFQSFRRRNPNDFISFGRNLTQEITAPATSLIGHLNQALPSNNNSYDGMRARVTATAAKLEQLKAA